MIAHYELSVACFWEANQKKWSFDRNLQVFFPAGLIYNMYRARMAPFLKETFQLSSAVEQSAVNRSVVGSIPTVGATNA